ncbi:MAG: choice-of-anchor I family protein [Aequorivita antarctica]
MKQITFFAILFCGFFSFGQKASMSDIPFEDAQNATLANTLIITEIFSGQAGTDLTADWFEIKNIGTDAWVSGVDGDLYYDDDSADPTTADIVQGISEIQPGGFAIVLITGDVNDVTIFTDVWGEVIDLTGVEVGYTDGAGLGGGGDTVTLWEGDPLTTSPINSASYPDTSVNDGQTYDVELTAFSVIGNANNAVETIALGGSNTDVPNIGSPGNGPAITGSSELVITEIFPGQAGTDLTADWFEIKNIGAAAWTSGVDGDLYYDDESADPTTADLIEGVSEIQPGGFAIVLIGDITDVATFDGIWSQVIDLTNVEVGFTDGAGLGAGGDAVNLWEGDPLTTSPIDSASYPDTSANDGQSYDVELAAFSIVGNANGAMETIDLGGDNSDVPNIGSPGNGSAISLVSVQFETPYVSISEDGTSVTINVEVSQAPTVGGTVDVSLTTGGTAVEGTDFTFATSQTLTFTAGSTSSQSVTIPIINNSEDGSDLFFVLSLTNESNVVIGTTAIFSVYILDDDTVVPAGDDTELDVNYLASYLVDAGGTAEITAYDPATQRLFVTNVGAIEVLDFSDPENITSLATVDITPFGSSVQSIAVSNGIVAVAISANDPLDNGFVLLADTDGNNPTILEVGSLPDMLTFSPDGTKLLVANEGQPSDDYTVDPEGSISVIDVSAGLGNITQADVTTLNFNSFDSQQAALISAGVRVFGPGATVSQDMEPEYIAVSDDSQMAYVTLQENNAYAIINLSTLEITDVISFGKKDHSLPKNSLDTSDETDFIFNASWPIKGLYMPDAVSYYSANGIGYIVTANEGDSRDYSGYAEERKLNDADYILDPAVFSEIDILKLEANLGDINVTAASGDADGDGLYEEIHIFGGRSFSIFEAETGNLVYDSGNDFEVITAADPNLGGIFNASNDNNNFKNRSDNKGPEPEGIVVKQIGDQAYAFILLERVGGMMVYNVTDPANPIYLQYVNSRGTVPGDPESGDLGPEGVVYIEPADSPTGKALVILSNEVSATLSIYSLDNVFLSVNDNEFSSYDTFKIYPNPAEDTVFFSIPDSYSVFDMIGRLVISKEEIASLNISKLSTGTYIIKNSKGISQKLIVK